MDLLRLFQEGQMSAVKTLQVSDGVIFDARFGGAVTTTDVFVHLSVSVEGGFI